MAKKKLKTAFEPLVFEMKENGITDIKARHLELYKSAIFGVNHAIENNLDTVHVHTLVPQGLDVYIDKDNYRTMLDNLLKYYINIEDYEMCNVVTDVINKLK